jgi:hypothetical protein
VISTDCIGSCKPHGPYKHLTPLFLSSMNIKRRMSSCDKSKMTPTFKQINNTACCTARQIINCQLIFRQCPRPIRKKYWYHDWVQRKSSINLHNKLLKPFLSQHLFSKCMYMYDTLYMRPLMINFKIFLQLMKNVAKLGLYVTVIQFSEV